MPKTITAQSGTDKKIPTNSSYSSQKCQNDAKQHSSYSRIFHPKLISNTKPTSIQPPPPPASSSSSSTAMQQQQQKQQLQQQRQYNGSYTRLTNKLNCCKSCVRDADDVLVKKCASEASIPKLKNATKYQSSSQFIDSNANCCYEPDDLKCRLLGDAHKTNILRTLRRNSFEANSVLRKSTFKRSLDDDLLNGSNFRHHSFDECTLKATSNQKLPKKQTPPQSNHQNDFHHCNGNGHVNYLMQPAGKQSTLIDNNRLTKQKSLDDYSDATARLRKLEMKMRKHKVDVLKYANNHNQTNIYTDQKKLLAYPPTNQIRSKSDPFARPKVDCVYPKIGIDSMLQSKTQSFRKNGTNGSYGIITSSELYKLRGTPERVT